MYEESPEFRDRYRFRAGIEGTMSQLDRLTGIKNLRVRGMSSESFAAYLKAAGTNIIRAAVFQNREIGGDPAVTAVFPSLSCAVKERFQRVIVAIRCWSGLQWPHIDFAALFAAWLLTRPSILYAFPALFTSFSHIG
ncbi:MAG: hypothetical protein HGB21_09615 [Nitrospirae bacterium]|nr:hypothetical protein [Nitrospirota bacterium]NTW66544.1 hypothetical protein [Nitrospirota bacterium]